MRLHKIPKFLATVVAERPLRAILRRSLFRHVLTSISLVSSVAVSASGNGKFVDVTKQSGIDFVHVSGASGQKYLVETTGSGAGFLDYDNDGFLDIFLVNGGRTPGFSSSASVDHALYRNNRDGTFTNVKSESGIQESGYALDSRRPHTLWSATAATAPSRGHRAAVVGPTAAAHCAPRGDGSG